MPRSSAVVPKTVTSRDRPPAEAAAVPITIGVTAVTEGTSRSTASASSSVRSCGATLTIGAPPKVSVFPGSTIRRFEPSEANSPVT